MSHNPELAARIAARRRERAELAKRIRDRAAALGVVEVCACGACRTPCNVVLQCNPAFEPLRTMQLHKHWQASIGPPERGWTAFGRTMAGALRRLLRAVERRR